MRLRTSRGALDERKSLGLTSLLRDTHPLVPLGHTRAKPSQKSNISHETLRFVIDAVARSTPAWEARLTGKGPFDRPAVARPRRRADRVLGATHSPCHA